jgi:integrase
MIVTAKPPKRPPMHARPRLCRVAGRDTWHIYDQRRRISTGCTNRVEAELVLSLYLREIEKPQLQIVSVASILDLYIQTRRDRNIPGLARLEFAHQPLSRILGDKPPAVINEAECLRYVAARRQEGIADATARTELAALGAAMRWAAQPGVKLISEPPKLTLPERPDPRIRWLTRDEAARLVAACRSPHVRLFIVIGLNTGARSGAILGLTWDRVDLINRLVDFREPGRQRTKKRRVPAAINDTLFAALTEARAVNTCEHVIEWAGHRVTTVKNGFHEAVVRAGLVDVSPHVLRHTAVTWQLQEGIPVWEVAGFVGMDPHTVQQVYGHHHSDHTRRAARALG